MLFSWGLGKIARAVVSEHILESWVSTYDRESPTIVSLTQDIKIDKTHWHATVNRKTVTDPAPR